MQTRRLPRDGEAFPVCRIRDRRVIGHDMSPMEEALSHTSVLLRHLRELAPASTREAPGSDDGPWAQERAWLERPDLQRPGELNAVALAAAGGVDRMMVDYIGSLRRHCWDWLIDARGVAQGTEKAFLVARMDLHFRPIRDRIEHDLQTMRRLAEDNERLGIDLPLDRAVLKHDIEAGLEAEVMQEIVDRNAEKAMRSVLFWISTLPEEDRVECENRLKEATGLASAEEAASALVELIKERGPSALGLPGGDPPTPISMDAADRARLAGRLKTAVQKKRAERAECRKRIKRACKLFDKLGLTEHLRDFNDGRDVTLRCRSGLQLRITMREGPWQGIVAQSETMEHWTVPFELQALSPAGRALGNLCAYAPGTPILDLLMGLMLHVEAGTEWEILDEANWYSMDDEEASAREMLALYGKTPWSLEQGEALVRNDPDAVVDFEDDDFDLAQWQRRVDARQGAHMGMWDAVRGPFSRMGASRSYVHEANGALWNRFDDGVVGPLTDTIDGAIADWFGRPLAMWSVLKPRLEVIYVGRQFPKIPMGWTDGWARAFSGKTKHGETHVEVADLVLA